MRSRLGIAAQAIAVATLATITYLAFIHPNDSGPLSGIEVEDGIGTETPPHPTTGTDRDRPRSAATARRAAPRPTPSTAAWRPTQGTVAPEPDSSAAVDTPAGSQYEDAVARILNQVAGAHP